MVASCRRLRPGEKLIGLVSRLLSVTKLISALYGICRTVDTVGTSSCDLKHNVSFVVCRVDENICRSTYVRLSTSKTKHV